MGKLLVSEQAQREKIQQARKKREELDKKFLEWQIENKVLVQPCLRLLRGPSGSIVDIHIDKDFLPLPDEAVKELIKRRKNETKAN